MTARRYTSSRPNAWVEPRWTDHAARTYRFGKLQPMDKPGFLARLVGRK